ncbi:discoidin domain-containing protein [Paenibacillus alba]|uniref:Discoidin domain-containing protein n=1 Tax=Paenibacillus alba TaxID=1197127 RepID=A0ABU6G6H5_9BACL|nr:discoidin domain-containing protein [Paenibacillus alba]MEC0229774.1 discoidin domain-containing protein [Paenibacillus alba]
MRKAWAASLAIIVASVSVITTVGVPSASADTITANHAQRIVSAYKGTWTSPPTDSNFGNTTNAPLLGNGDVGAVMVGNMDAMTIVLSKNEFFSVAERQLKSMVRLGIAVSGMTGSSYLTEQKLASAQVDGTFALSGNTINTSSWVQATDTTNNLFMTKFTYTGSGSKNATISLAPANQNTFTSSIGSSGDILYRDVRADSADTVNGITTIKARIATRVIGTTGTISNNQLQFTLTPGSTYTLVTSIMSNKDSANYQALALSNISSKTQADIDSLKAAHQSWWDAFYTKSFVEIPNKTIEKSFYGSLYLLGSSSRTGEAPPGLWGAWIARNSDWGGDYHLNYNTEAPFYFAMPTNHIELAGAYDKPVLDWIPKAQTAAASAGFTGVYYPVGIGPFTMDTDGNYHNQKTNAVFGATVMLDHYYATADAAYANSIYAYLKEAAKFWQNYLTWDGSRYVITNDAQHEGDVYPQTNGVMSLGLVRYVLQGCIDISTALGQDTTLRSTWQNILNNLSAFPTQTRNSQTVFRYTEVGRDWSTDNAIGIQHIYPGRQIGLSSSASLIQTAKNMIGQMSRWTDGNGTNTFYPAAARVGYDPATILSQLSSFVSSASYANMHIKTSGGGIENFNVVPATLAEMMLQSFQNKIRVFANWPTGTDAKYGDLRADGAFLISSSRKNNQVEYVRLISEKGKTATVANPWSGQTVRVYRNGVDSGTMSGTDLTIPTSANETVHLALDGTSYATILSNMNQALGQTFIETVTASSTNSPSGEEKEKAFDGSPTTKWLIFTNAGWIQYHYTSAKVINKYEITSANDVPARDPKNWTLKGSNDGTNWTTLDTRTNEAFANRLQVKAYTFANNTAYANYRLDVSANNGDANLQIAEIAFYEGATTPSNVALNKTVTASDEINATESAAKAIDGGTTTKWTSQPLNLVPGDKWLKVDLGTSYAIHRWVVKHAGSNGEAASYNTKDFKLQKSSDGTNWTDVDAVTGNTAATTDRTVASFSSRYVRLYITTTVQSDAGYAQTPGDRSNARIYEFEVYGN